MLRPVRNLELRMYSVKIPESPKDYEHLSTWGIGLVMKDKTRTKKETRDATGRAQVGAPL
jgi:hypothetical protein